MSPYKKYLQELLKGPDADEVTITRASAPDVTGKLSDVDDNGCIIVSEEGDTAESTFIADRDIRGVRSKGWNMAAIADH